MPAHIKNERMKLLRKRESLLRDLTVREPLWVAQFEDVERRLELLGTPDNLRFSAGGPMKQFRRCFEFEQRELSRAELVDLLIEGGYPIEGATRAKGLLSDAVSYNLSRGNLIEKNGKLQLAPEK